MQVPRAAITAGMVVTLRLVRLPQHMAAAEVVLELVLLLQVLAAAAVARGRRV